MNRKAVSGIMLTLLLTSMLMLAFNIQPVKAEGGTIYIRADGSVDPSTAPILNVGNIYYTFTADIYDSIVVERDNIVVNGAGYTVQGTGAYESKGISLKGRSNVTITNMEIKAFYTGILLSQSSNNTISENNITTNNWYGILLYYSSNNTISGNNITNNTNGIVLDVSSNNTISGNHVTANTRCGIGLGSSSNNILRGNVMANNKANFGVWGWNLSQYVNDVDVSNTVDGKPIYYFINKRDMDVPPDAGYVALVNSTRIVVKKLKLTNNCGSILLAYTTSSKITENNITNNEIGIVLDRSSNNSIYHNNFVNNERHVYNPQYSVNVWDDGYPSGGNYWSDYTDEDLYSGPYQNETGSDGIWDHPYVMDANNQDHYPLVEPWTPAPSGPLQLTYWHIDYVVMQDIDNDGITLGDELIIEIPDPQTVNITMQAVAGTVLNMTGVLQDVGDETILFESPNVELTVEPSIYESYVVHEMYFYKGRIIGGYPGQAGYSEPPILMNPNENVTVKEHLEVIQDCPENVTVILLLHFEHSLAEDNAPTCIIELQKDGVEIDEIDVWQFFDIYIGDSTDDTGIKQVRFSSDDDQDNHPTGEWTDWYDWNISSGDWDASTKIKCWAFDTAGYKEVWAEVKDDINQTHKRLARIYVPESQPPTCVIALQKDGVEIDGVDVGQFFDIYVGGSTDDAAIKQVCFSSDDSQDGTPAGEWTEWYDWDRHLGDWDPVDKIKKWSFDTPGKKEVWAMIEDSDGNVVWNHANIFVHPGYAIIVAGHADWRQKSAIDHSANNAYRVLRNLGFNNDHIFYLNTVPQQIDGQNVVDEYSSLDALRNSLDEIHQRIGEAPTPLILYLVGHGIKEVFDFYTESDALSSTDLRDMLEPFHDNLMLIVIGSCYSGSFITLDQVTDSISGNDRIIITATHDDEKRKSLLGLGGWYHSSDRFWGNLNKGMNVKDAFITNVWPGERKHLWLDDNGDARGNPPDDLKDDGELATRTTIGVPGTEDLDLTSWYSVWIHSACELRVYDSQNRVTGLVNGETKEEIPNSIYDEENRIVAIFSPSDTYRYEIAGTDTGTYGLDIAFIKDGEAIPFTATDIPTFANAIHQYTIDWDALSRGEEGVTVQIDSDGDGVFEQTITADNELTHDEFALQTATTIDFDSDTLNLESEGKVVTVYIELPEGHNVSDIDVSSVMLNGTVPALTKPTEIGDYDGDGVPDLMVKFNRQDLIAILSVSETTLTITGEVNGIPFEGSDTTRVIGK